MREGSGMAGILLAPGAGETASGAEPHAGGHWQRTRTETVLLTTASEQR